MCKAKPVLTLISVLERNTILREWGEFGMHARCYDSCEIILAE